MTTEFDDFPYAAKRIRTANRTAWLCERDLTVCMRIALACYLDGHEYERRVPRDRRAGHAPQTLPSDTWQGAENSAELNVGVTPPGSTYF